MEEFLIHLQVFTGNSNTCMKITSHQVHKIMNLVTVHKEAVPQLLDLLNAIVKVEELDLPLKRNQSFVMQYFMQYRADIAHVIDQDENARYDMVQRVKVYSYIGSTIVIKSNSILFSYKIINNNKS